MEERELETAIFAGGCFWCTEAVFSRIEGVENVVSGYTGGNIKNPAYREICTGRTGHAEAVQITFDPAKVSFRGLLEVFFATHNPTTLNQQGNDIGSQYRSAVFYTSKEQQEQAISFIEMLEEEKVFENKIVTEVTEANTFYLAEDYHQDYYKFNKDQPYCEVIISPKLEKLEKYYKNKLKKADAV
ncbi:peptide-methionine (S)-S-oxide reductase MsrA [Abyssalbus ytuae]|uniref:Peptide methionine sulfoxide reductase MsrA n=1 Tax=Abyssalbus ytuae TaxID=2926907 RepID=A0A9E6ZKI5_9FLAO|nr:peptide-methionine (S)-S-oxide reductase MsrA [Abyssalbus ytuae]UOB17387.1 peptide-methionine (S)-S-oxide reductase MsrA [Abyssalbus ytuae]